MLKILSYGAAFAAGAIIANGEIREGLQITTSDALQSASQMVAPREEQSLGYRTGFDHAE